MTLRRALLLCLLALVAAPASASAIGKVPEGAVWTEASIPSTDGVVLHADILRPKHVPEGEKVPVILSIGPYFSHSGQVGPAGPVQGAPYDPVGPKRGPSERFLDLVEGAKLMERGYAFVMVDIRGFGGSTGCLDWVGPGEQADVVAAVEWAAKQPWSTGKVGMYGKSYDASTGLAGVNHEPEGLAAVVAQEPVYDMYRYLYGDGIRRLNSLATPALYEVIDLAPGPLADGDVMYQVNGANDTQRPGCKALNWAEQAGDEDHYSPYWRARNLITGAKGSKVPLFLMQGLTENNTVADGMAQYLENHAGPQRGWLGPWEHIRGNERNAQGRLYTGREGFLDEVMGFYDEHLRGIEPDVKDPVWAVQANDGVWREATSWPPADAREHTTSLRTGTYTDDGQGSATGGSATQGIWSVSQPVAHTTHLAGSGKVVVDVSTTVPRANLAVDVYDLDEDGEGPLITRQGHMIHRNGKLELELWSADWILQKGHRIGVRITDANTDWWMLTVPTQAKVTVHDARVTLPFLTKDRGPAIDGEPGTQLDSYLGRVVRLPEATIEQAETEFDLPGPLG
jgi:uncharacterized protein